MDDLEQVPLIAAEVVGGALLVLLTLGAVLLSYLLVRRRRLAASAPCLSCGLREQGRGRWRSVLIRLDTHSLDCFTMLSLRLRARRSWTRGAVEISTPREASGLVPGLSDPVVVLLTLAGAEEAAPDEFCELAIERTAYPALRSWTESGPPRANSVV